VAEIRGVFGSVGVYARVCESKSWPLLFFVLQRPNFEWYPRPFWSQKYTPDCRKSHLIFQNYLGRPRDFPPALAPSTFGSGLRPLTAPPSKIPGSDRCRIYSKTSTNSATMQAGLLYSTFARLSNVFVVLRRVRNSLTIIIIIIGHNRIYIIYSLRLALE